MTFALLRPWLRWVLAVLLAAGLPARALPPAPAPASLRVVLDDDYPPYVFRGADGALQGILVDQWSLWQRKTGVPVTLTATSWSEAQRRMQAGEYDVIDTIFENEGRRALYDFGPAYARIDVPVFLSQGLSGIAQPRDLAGFVVGAKRGDNAVDLLRTQGVDQFLLFDSYASLVAAARDGKVKVFTVDEPPAMYHLIKMGIQDRFRRGATLYSGAFHRAVKKGDAATLALMQRGFDAITPAEYAAIDRRWFGSPIRPGTRVTLLLALGGLLALALFFAARNFVERRRMEASLRASERTISSHFTHGMFYQVRVEPDGKRVFTYLSPSVQELYGVSVAEAKADASLIYSRIHPEDLPGLTLLEEEAIRTVTPFRAEARVMGADGSYRWSSYASSPRLQKDGSIYWEGVEFIITERKASEEALRQREADVRSLLRAIPDLIFTFGRDGRYLGVHASDPRLLLEPETNLLGRSLDEVLPPDLAEQFRRAIGEALDRNAVQVITYSLRLPAGEAWFEARIVPSSADQVIALVRDVSSARRMEEEQRRLQSQLIQAQKMESLGSLAGGVAHDMNNVLGAILAIASNNLDQVPEGGSQARAFDTIVKAATRGGQMVRTLLNFARQTPVKEEVVDLNAVLGDVAQLLERTTLARVRLEFRLAPDLHAMRGDAGSLSHAIMNLCVNAVDAMEGEGTLTLGTRNLEGEGIEVFVQDTGCGMPPEVLGKAMDPFFTTKEVGKGTGLGLSMVYGVVKAHQGRFDLESEPGRGTRATLAFPGIPRTASGPEADPASGPSLGRRGALDLLLVDDDEFLRGSLVEILGSLGHRVASAASGEEGLARIRQGLEPDLVILDVNMPGLGGSGTLPLLRDLRPELPVLLVTGKADQAAVDLAGSYPRVTLLPKPFTIRELREHLDV